MRRLEVAEVEVQDLRRRLEDAESEVETLSKEGPRALAAEADLMRLSRDYDVLIQHYEQLIKHREATQLASNLPAGHQRTGYRIVDRPLHPVEPSGPPRGLLVIGVFVAGIGAGGAFAILRLLMTGTVLTAAQLQGAFKTIPILGGVAVAPLPQLRGQRLKSRVGAAGAAISLVAACGLLFLYHENSSLALNGVSPSTDLAQLVVNKISSLFASREATAGL
jgi:hypothetical protein